jgi:hypothetical protein
VVVGDADGTAMNPPGEVVGGVLVVGAASAVDVGLGGGVGTDRGVTPGVGPPAGFGVGLG